MILRKATIEDKIFMSKELIRKVSDKKYSLQFLPEVFEKLVDKKHITYNNKKLKVDYIIDIINSLILKYYFKKENAFLLNATILRDRYGYLYNYYINYLKDTGTIILKANYRKGINSRIYALNNNILKDKITKYKNYDKILLRKYKSRTFKTIENSGEIEGIDSKIKERLIVSLFNIDIDFDRSLFFLNTLKDKDIDIYNRNLYSVDSIRNKHIFYHFDKYGRMHTNYTILRSFIRKNCLLIDGEKTFEIDISNSQPLFLSKLILETQTNWVKADEFSIFRDLTKNGKYYQYLVDVLGLKDKKEAKKLTYKVLFGKNYKNSKPDSLFKKAFPGIHNFICLYKKEHGGYKILSHHLQKMESNLIYNKIIGRILSRYPEMDIITIHDSIIVKEKYKDDVSSIFNSELLSEFDF